MSVISILGGSINGGGITVEVDGVPDDAVVNESLSFGLDVPDWVTISFRVHGHGAISRWSEILRDLAGVS